MIDIYEDGVSLYECPGVIDWAANVAAFGITEVFWIDIKEYNLYLRRQQANTIYLGRRADIAIYLALVQEMDIKI